MLKILPFGAEVNRLADEGGTGRGRDVSGTGNPGLAMGKLGASPFPNVPVAAAAAGGKLKVKPLGLNSCAAAFNGLPKEGRRMWPGRGAHRPSAAAAVPVFPKEVLNPLAPNTKGFANGFNPPPRLGTRECARVGSYGLVA